MRKNYRKRKFNRKRKNTFKIFFLTLVGMTLGFASINTTLQLIGTLNISRTTWDIHFQNPTKIGGVTATKEVQLKQNDNTTVEYQIKLTNPGDYYEFTVEAVNNGTIDAMVTGISNKIYENNVEVNPTYLESTITYSDGTSIDNNHFLASNQKDIYKVKVQYKTNLSADQLPDSEKTYNYRFTVTYMQADENAESTIILDNQNATTPGTQTIKAKYNKALTSITPPTKTGSTFQGYYDNVNAYEMTPLVYSLPNNLNELRIGFFERGRYQTTTNGWSLTTNGDKNTHINGKFKTTKSIKQLDFNDMALDETQYKITEENGEYIVYVDFDVTEEMVTQRVYNYNTDYRFIDVQTYEDGNQITIYYMVKNAKKYYDSTGTGLINYDLLTNTKLYAIWN